MTDHGYDPLTQRLRSLRTVRGADVLQDLAYTYDAVGNVVRITDAAQQTVFFRNTVVGASADYTYDATYQLVAATGREHLGQLGDPVPPDPYDTGATGLDAPGDGQAMGHYQETYSYDPVGNILAVRHAGSDAAHPGWTRTYTYGPGNRLAETVTGAGTPQTYTYDEHGSMTSMPHLPLMVWDHADRLRATATHVVPDRQPETTWYAYDGSGQRARWVTLRSAVSGEQPTRKCERIYAGGFEVYREYDGTGSTVTLERLSLSVLDGTKRIALADRRTIGDDGSPDLLVRFQFGNHLGSASLELDVGGKVISYEEYHPYGSTSYQAVEKGLCAAAKRYRFTGMERDEATGLEYHSARYYAPWLGRWTAADPAGLVDGTNRYRYGTGSPVCRGDPAGRQSVDVSEHVLVEGEAGPSKPHGFWATGAGKALAFAGGVVVGFGVGVATAFIAGLLLPEIVVAGLGVALLGAGLAAAVIHRRDIANRASRLASGEATTQEWYEAGEVVGGLASARYAGAATSAGAATRNVAGRLISQAVNSTVTDVLSGTTMARTASSLVEEAEVAAGAGTEAGPSSTTTGPGAPAATVAPRSIEGASRPGPDQALVGRSRDQMRGAAERMIRSDPAHPLRFLLDARGRFKPTGQRGQSNDVLIDNPDLIQMGHIRSDKAGGEERLMIQGAWENQRNANTLEVPGSAGFVEDQPAISIGRIAVDLKTAQFWEDIGWLPPGTVENAPIIRLP